MFRQDWHVAEAGPALLLLMLVCSIVYMHVRIWDLWCLPSKWEWLHLLVGKEARGSQSG